MQHVVSLPVNHAQIGKNVIIVDAALSGILYLSIELQSDMWVSVSGNSGFHLIKLVEVWWKVSFQDEVILFLLG